MMKLSELLWIGAVAFEPGIASQKAAFERIGELLSEETGAPAEFAAGGEWNGVVTLRVPEVADRVSGFKLLAFYP